MDGTVIWARREDGRGLRTIPPGAGRTAASCATSADGGGKGLAVLTTAGAAALGATGLTGAGARGMAAGATRALATGFAAWACGLGAAGAWAGLAAFWAAAGATAGLGAAAALTGLALGATALGATALGAAALGAADGLTACAFTCCLLAESAGGGVSPCVLISGCARDCSGRSAPGNMILNKEANMKPTSTPQGVVIYRFKLGIAPGPAGRCPAAGLCR